MPFTKLAGASAAAKALAPTACTTIEEVGSTGVGALTLGFLALAVTTVVMVAKVSAGSCRAPYRLRVSLAEHLRLFGLANLGLAARRLPTRTLSAGSTISVTLSSAVWLPSPTSPCFRDRAGPPSLDAGSSSTLAMLIG